MKYFIILFIVAIFTLFCCKNPSSNDRNNDTLKSYNRLLKLYDSICTVDSKKANEDIIQNKLVYFHSFGMTKQFRSNKEMNKLLSSYKIKIDTTSVSCLIPDSINNCYAKQMQLEISKRFGVNFIDSLRNIAEINYVKNNLNRIYNFEECDTVSRYPNDKYYSDFFKSYERDLFLACKISCHQI